MKFKRLLTAVLAALMLLCVIPYEAFAANWGQGDTLDDALSELKVGFDDKLLDWLMLPNLGTIYLRYTYFRYNNERTDSIDEHPVYCIDPTKGGAKEIVAAIGPNNDGSQTATYIRGEKVGDARYRSIMYNGYPHMRYTGLGLENKEEAYYATKLALWMYIRGNNPDKLTINPKYGNSDPVALRVRDAAIQIYTNGTKSIIGAAREPKITLTGKPSATANLDANGEYYVQGIEVYASGWVGTNPDTCGDVQLSWDSPPPAGTIVLGTDGEDITSSMGVKVSNTNGTGYFGKVTVKYPASEIDAETFNPPTLNASALVPNDGIYVAYAQVNKDKYQRYLVESDPKIDVTTSFVSQIFEPDGGDFPSDSGLRIHKLETGTNTPLFGAVFEIRDPDGKLIYSMATDASGIIDIPLYVTGNYTVTEVTPPEYHLLSENRTQSVSVRYGEVAEVTFTNAPYGTLRVVKRDAANGQPLGGAAVRIRNITTNTTQEAHTDSSGSAIFEKLPIGAYEIVELTAPDGYELDTTVHTVNVVPLSEGETSYPFTNKALPGLRITKFDRQTMTPIEGVTFEVWHDGELYGTFATDAWGEIELHNIPAGTWTAREVATVAPYVLDTTAQWIEIKAGQEYISDLYFFNLVKPGISLVKIDSETFEPLVNARYLIKHVGGSFTKEYTTDANGEINLSELDPGTYQVIEQTAPDGYLIDDAIRTIQINAGENAQFVFTNTRKPVLEVLKFDGTNYLPGATFRIAKIEDGSHYLDRITDMDGRIRIEDLEPGIYSVQELQPPPGYLPNETEYHVEMFPGRTSQLVVNNVKKPDLCIVKTDANTGLPIEGVTYTVRKVDSSTLETVKTDKNGEAWMYALDEGVYQITEQSVPAGYLLDTEPQLITLVGGRTGVARFQNYPRPKLRILKVDAVTGEPLANAEFRVSKVDGGVVGEYITDASGEIIIENLDVARYRVEEFMAPDGYLLYDEYKEILLEPGKTSTLKFDDIRKPTLIITKTNAVTYEPIPNTTYKVEYEDASGGVHTLGTYRTNENGQIVIKNANPGWYIITETQAAPGFSLSSTPVTRKYLAPGENAYTNFNANGEGGDVSGNNVRIMSGYDYIIGHEILDYPLNSIVIRKVSAVTGELLAGAAFELRQVSEDISGSSGTLIGRYTTDNSGTIVITGLVPGGYIVTEVQAPANYLLSENAQQQVWLKPDGTSIVEATFANYPYGAILITKVDAQTNKPLPNARFRVTDSSGAVVGSSNGEYITDENGEILIPNVKPGSYVITEVEAPANYAVDTTPQTITVGMDGGIFKVSFKNQPAGQIVIRKFDSATREPLAGAEFRVTASDGSVVGTGNGIFKTDATGTVTIPNLPKGSFVITETAAPSGYLLENQTQTVAVDYGKTYTIDIYNKKLSGLQIIKIDADSKQPLKGARFTVYRMDGGVIGTYETNGDGVIILETLSPGWYKIAETKAPDGYLIDDEPQDVEITANQFVKLTFENRRLASLQIKKIDEYSGAPLAGATFEVRQQNGAFVGEYTTDQSGIASIPAVSPGWFLIKELTAPSGYLLDETAKTVEVKATVPTVVTFTNKPLSGLQIKKIDSVSKKPLAGAVFKVTDSMGTVVGTANGEYTTDSNGMILITGLKPGAYTATEIKCPDGYVMDSSPKTIEVTDGKLFTLEFTNTPMGGLQIKKISSVTKEPLPGAVFKITDSRGTVVGTANGEYTTGKDGTILIPNLTPGTYIAIEVRAPSGYIADYTPQSIAITDEKLYTLTFENTPQPGLQILKIDEETRRPIAGVEFAVSEMNGKQIGTYRTDDQGLITLPELSAGWYTATEVKAAKGYLIDTAPHNIEIKNGSTAVLTVTNRKSSGIIIHKIDSVTKKGIYGVTFLLYDEYNTPIGQYESDQDGYVYIGNGLEDGKYKIRELTPASGYAPDDTVRTIYLEYGRTTEIEWENVALKGQIIVTKRSAQYNEVTGLPAGSPLSGAVFEVYSTAGNLVDRMVSDSKGVAASQPLPLGVYFVKEVSPPKYYALNSREFFAELKHNGDIVRFECLDENISLGVTIQKKSQNQATPGQTIYYDLFNIANISSSALENFYVHDRLPTDAVRGNKVFTGTWSDRLTYRITYKTNYSSEYRVLASGLSTKTNYELSIHPNVLGLADGEYVTDIRWEFGTVPSGFKSVENPKLMVQVLPTLPKDYKIVNRADVGGMYIGEWETAQTSWTTIVIGGYNPPALPKTGY